MLVSSNSQYEARKPSGRERVEPEQDEFCHVNFVPAFDHVVGVVGPLGNAK
jgi:hypothetical protein